MQIDALHAIAGPPAFLAKLFDRRLDHTRKEKGVFSAIASDGRGGFEKKVWRLLEGETCHSVYSGTKYLAIRAGDGILILPGVLDMGRKRAKCEVCFLDLGLFHPYPEEIATSGYELHPLLGIFKGSDGTIWGQDVGNWLYAVEWLPEGKLWITPGPRLEGVWAAAPIEIDNSVGERRIVLPFRDHLIALDPNPTAMKITEPFFLNEYASESYELIRGQPITGRREDFFLLTQGAAIEIELLEKGMRKVGSLYPDSTVHGTTRPVVVQKGIWYVTGDGQVVGLSGGSNHSLSITPTGCRVSMLQALAVSEDRYLHILEDGGNLLIFDTWKKKMIGVFNLFEKMGKSQTSFRVKGVYAVGNTLFVNWLYAEGQKETWGLAEVTPQGPRLAYEGIDHNIGRVTEIL